MKSFNTYMFTLIVLFSLCVTAAGEEQPKPSPTTHPSQIHILSVPAEIGIVREQFEGTASISFILIQREGEPADQINYGKMIRSLAKRPPLSTLPYAVILFRPNAAESKDLADFTTIAMRETDTNAEPRRTELMQRIGRYATVIKRMKNITEIIEQERLSKELRALTSKSEDLRNNFLTLDDYTRFLVHLSKKTGVPLTEFKQVMLFLTVLRLEKRIEPGKAGYQKEELIDTLKPVLFEKDRAKLRESSVAFKNGELSKNAYFTLLESLARKNGIPLERYNYLADYIDYLQATANLDKNKLGEECRQINEKLEHAFLSHQVKTQEELVATLKDLRVFFQLLSLSPLRSDYAYYVQHKTSYEPERFKQFLTTQAERLLDNPALSEEQVMSITMMDHSLEQIGGLCALLPEIDTFVGNSFSKEDAMLEDAIVRMQDKQISVGVLIGDGAALAVIKNDLKKRGIHYSVISPSTSEPTREELFPQTMIKKGR